MIFPFPEIFVLQLVKARVYMKNNFLKNYLKKKILGILHCMWNGIMPFVDILNK